jgi:hypothetical protein
LASGVRLVAGNQDVVVLVPETWSTAGDEVLQHIMVVTVGGTIGKGERMEERFGRTGISP